MVSLCFSKVLNTEIIYLKNMFLRIIVNKFKPFAIFATPKDRRSELNCVSWAMDGFFLCHEHLQRNEAFSIKRISFKMKKFSVLCICRDQAHFVANAQDPKNIHRKWCSHTRKWAFVKIWTLQMRVTLKISMANDTQFYFTWRSFFGLIIYIF